VEFFVSSNETQPEVQAADFFMACDDKIKQATRGELMEASDPEVLRKLDPEYFNARLDEIAEGRSHDNGSMRGCEFRKVASFTNVPLFEALRIQEGLLKGKKELYKLLLKYPQYRAYRKEGADHSRVTFIDGKSIAY
jgi:hypothetical protein